VRVLFVCQTCTTRFAPGLPFCPGCTSYDCRPDYEVDAVPKVTVHGGVSNAAQDAQDAAVVAEPADAAPVPVEAASVAPEAAPDATEAPADDAPAEVAPVEAPKPAKKTTARRA
jgi:hypothetical protein